MKIGYARVSTTDQNLDRQIQEFNKSGVEKIFQEKLSGKNMTERKELQKALEFVREGDTLYIESLERLGRNYNEIIHTVQQLEDNKVGLVVLNMPILNQDLGEPNLQKLVRNLIIQILSWAAENERKENKRKQKQGIEIAKQKGYYKGRPIQYSANAKNPKDRNTYFMIVNHLNNNKAVKQIAEKTGVSRDTVYRIKDEILK
jgi:DNA invertase Pin-like site-specific DNA recombinase